MAPSSLVADRGFSLLAAAHTFLAADLAASALGWELNRRGSIHYSVRPSTDVGDTAILQFADGHE